MKYEYNVEYVCNGNRPKLGDDILLSVTYIDTDRQTKTDNDIVKNWYWDCGLIQTFRIIDPRFIVNQEVTHYEWNVVYPTYGKKPNICDDIIVQTAYRNLNGKWGTHAQPCGSVPWDSTIKFRITDERYSNNKTTVHSSSWYSRKELPPSGTECEYYYKDEWRKVFVVGLHHFADQAIISTEKNCGKLFYGSKDKFRPIKTELDDLTNIIADASPASARALADIILNAGFRTLTK